MALVKGKETKPEISVRKFLFSKGFRYRKNSKALPGTPDIVLTKYRTVVFVNGCFWHGHKNCLAATSPKSNQDYWLNKIEANKTRDIKKLKALKKLGWRTMVIWECEIKRLLADEKMQSKLIKSITKTLSP